MRALLLRLYPARWRARYGDEFEAILEERPLGPFDVADILLGAWDARLRLRGLGVDLQKGTRFSMSLRLGGAAAIVGAVLFPAGLIVSSLEGGPYEVLGGAIVLVGSGALLLALIGLSSFQARQHPRLIWAAFALPAVGTVLSITGLVAMAAVGDRPFVVGLSPWPIWLVGVIAMVFGSGLFALATYRTHALPRFAAGSLAVGSGLLLLAMFGMAGSDSAAPALVVAGLLAFSIGWIAVGWAAIGLHRPAVITA